MLEASPEFGGLRKRWFKDPVCVFSWVVIAGLFVLAAYASAPTFSGPPFALSVGTAILAFFAWMAVPRLRGETWLSWNVFLLTQTKDFDDWPTRLRAARRLAKLGDPKAVIALVEALRSYDADAVHHTVIEALVKIADTRAVDGLVEALCDPHDSTRLAAADVLKRLGQTEWAARINGTERDFDQLRMVRDTRIRDSLTRMLMRSVPVGKMCVSPGGGYYEKTKMGKGVRL
jgi:hypothetical protein